MNIHEILDFFKEVWQFLNTPIFTLKGGNISVSSVIIAFTIVWLSFRFANLMGKVINKALDKRSVDSGVRDSLEKFSRYLILVIGVFIAVDSLGISLSSLAALGAILMVGIGFGLQNITQNFISGVILLIERPVKVGDIVRVGETTGKIVDIRVRSTVIQTRDDISIIVPNSKFVAEEVVNESFLGLRIRKHVKVGVAYGSNLNLVKKALLDVALANPEVLEQPGPDVVFENFGESSLDFDLRFWSASLWEIDRISSDLRLAIAESFQKNNIQIPFPQRDLHIKSSMENGS